jgi:nanoRNase/pAp phosphatase (c-di-AMP/oligoRNAs hydrolase)
MVHVWLDIIHLTAFSKFHKETTTQMKKLLVFALGLGIALGTVSFSFAQDTTDTTKKAKKTKKKKAEKTETTK